MINNEVKTNVIAMHYQGFSYNQIARQLKLSKGQVAGLIHRHRALHGEAQDGIGTQLRAGTNTDSLSSISAQRKR